MRKVLVWDGDETLWRGTLLEGDQPELPSERWDQCAALADRGVLQCLASHNLESDARAALHALDLDRLFVATRASLDESKPSMIRALVEQLNLTRFDDLVFVDDNASHRAEVADALPGVLVAEPEAIPDIIEREFSKAVYTAEDRLRVRRYKDEIARNEASTAYGEDRLSFLRACEMRLSLRPPSDHEWVRVADLVARSNQFSALAKPYSEQELREFGPELQVAHVADRYGDYGLSGVVVDRDGCIPLLVVSCRLAGKGIGSALVATIVNDHPDQPTRALWTETPYNTGLVELFRWHRFLIRQTGQTSRYAFRPWSGPAEWPEWITRDDRA